MDYVVEGAWIHLMTKLLLFLSLAEVQEQVVIDTPLLQTEEPGESCMVSIFWIVNTGRV